jgi:ligand-binding sensor domain-containing protein
MKTLNAINYSLLLLLFYSSIFSQNNAIDRNSDTSLNFKKIKIEIEGEEVFDVDIITQDHQGYIWLATNLGLIRYNGIEGKKYDINRDDFSLIAYDYIESLFVDHLGDLWIGANSGLNKYNSNSDSLFQYPSFINDIKLTMVRAITEDKNRNIWIGTRNDGLFLFERESNSFSRVLLDTSHSLSLKNNRISNMIVDQNNNLWIGTRPNDTNAGAGLLRFDINSGKIKQFLHDPTDPGRLIDNRISSLYEDQQGRILIGTFKCGFHIYNPDDETLTRKSYDANNPGQIHAPFSEEKVFGNDPYVKIIHQDQKGRYWIGTTGKGVNLFNIRTNTSNNYNFNLVNPQMVWSIFEDRQGSIWLGGVMGSGLFRTDLFERKYNVNTNYTNVEVVYESSLNPGTLWVASQESGISKMDLKTGEIKKYLHNEDNIHGIGHSWVRSAYQENSKILWLGLGNGGPYGGQAGNGGLDRMDLEKEEFKHFKLIREDDSLGDYSYTPYIICEDNEGHLWLGTGPGGIFRSNKDKTAFKPVEILKNDNSQKDVFLNIVRIDSNGDIWASDFAGEGTLYLYDWKEERFSPYLKGFKMYNLIIDEKGWFWISTWEKGLIHLNPVDNTFIQYTKKDGLPSNDVVDFVEDIESNFWIGTRMGPAKFNTENGHISPIDLPIARYNRGILIASDHQIYLSANNGLVSFYPSQVIGNPYAPEVILESINVTGGSFNLLNKKSNDSEILLSHEQNDLTFEYAGLHYSDPAKNQYQYMLEPYDTNWVEAGVQRTTRYTNLDPGEYTFRVIASNSDGVWNEKGASINLIINKPWWETYLAFLVYLLYLWPDRKLM